MLRKYGAMDAVFSQEQYAQIPMAVQGIVMKVFQIVISTAVGLAAGCITIVGYNVGAGRSDRALKLFRLLLMAEAGVGALALFIVECFPGQLTAIFGAANESEHYTQFALRAFRIYLSTTVLACVNKGVFIYLQSLGRALVSTLLSMVREILFGVGFALLQLLEKTLTPEQKKLLESYLCLAEGHLPLNQLYVDLNNEEQVNVRKEQDVESEALKTAEMILENIEGSPMRDAQIRLMMQTDPFCNYKSIVDMLTKELSS